MSKSDKKSSKGNKAEFQRAMGRLEDAVKELGDAAKGSFADRAAEVLEQTAAKLKSEVDGGSIEEPRRRRSAGYSGETQYDEADESARASFAFGGNKSDTGRLGHWRGEGSPRPFRDLDNGKLWGICAGIAPYLGLEVWVVRCLAVTAFVFAPQIIVPAYIIGYFVLDARSELDEILGNSAAPTTRRMRKRHAKNQKAQARAEARAEKRTQRKEKRRSSTPSSEAPAPLPARNVLRNVQGTLNEAELRLRRMEGHVTSGRYELQKELRKIEQTSS